MPENGGKHAFDTTHRSLMFGYLGLSDTLSNTISLTTETDFGPIPF